MYRINLTEISTIAGEEVPGRPIWAVAAELVRDAFAACSRVTDTL